MLKAKVIEKALEFGFEDIGFTGAEPFGSQLEVLNSRSEEYAWTAAKGLDLVGGTDPGSIYPQCRSIIVLLESYYSHSFPRAMEGSYGRCYLDDDRVTKVDLSQRIKKFRLFLREQGIESKVPFNLPHRLAAARSGLGTFGKNCLLYSSRVARRSSFILPVAVLVNHDFEPDEPTLEVGCPVWCKNACLVACPTGALKGPRKIDPRLCVSYLTYYGEGITPRELREPMGMWVYGCDRCQNVCPRNAAWMARDLPPNPRVAAKAGDFELSRLLHMDIEYFKTRIWPHMFYIPPKEIWRWKMNVARVMGNSLDPAYTGDLIRALGENADDRVRGMAAWALGRIGGAEARSALEGFLVESSGPVREEVVAALEMCR